MKRIILDVDTGTDDACAIVLALKSTELKVEALTSVMGNNTIERTTRNTCKVLEIMAESEKLDTEHIPVAQGMHRPLTRLAQTSIASLVYQERARRTGQTKIPHSTDGLGGLIDSGYLKPPKLKPIRQHAVDLIIEKIMENPGEITLVPVGPMTNIAMAILKEPKVAENVEEIIHMGGAYQMNPHGNGNMTPVSEFNDWSDPEALKIVFECGAKITTVPLDVTTHPTARITETHLTKLRSDDLPQDLVARVCRSRMRTQGAVIHDALTIATAIDKSFVTIKPYHVHVVTMVPDDDPTRGMTMADTRAQTIMRRKEDPTYNIPNVDVAVEVDGARWIDFFIDRVKK